MNVELIYNGEEMLLKNVCDIEEFEGSIIIQYDRDSDKTIYYDREFYDREKIEKLEAIIDEC